MRACRVVRWSWALLILGAASALVGPSETASSPAARMRPMSFHNRLLLNRAVVTGLETIEVMVLLSKDGFTPAAAVVERLGGRVRRAEAGLGYMRVELPTPRLLDLIDSADVEAYQIASMSRASWYRDGPPQSNAQMHRGFEVAAPSETTPPAALDGLPPLTPELAHHAGYTGEDDAGVREWMRAHPTYDGRGVTIALIESGLPSFVDPVVGPAKTIDGREVPKIAGILNAIDPEQQDETRVDLATIVRAASIWCRVGGRTYLMPHPGTYRFGLFTLPAGANLVYQFGVIRDDSGSVWVDANGNADFQDESAVADVNDRFDVRRLTLARSRPSELSFVVGRGRVPNVVHLYTGAGGHQTMTLSVAAGSRSRDGLAFGVAPAAHVLLVRANTAQYRFADLMEGYIEAARHPDVDVLCDSAGITTVPDTAADFAGLFLRRIATVYQKPVIHSASNMQLFLNSAYSGDGFSVGGSIGPATFAALYGGGSLADVVVHPTGAAGPALDGAIKPDFLAPMHRLAADVPWAFMPIPLPKNAPAYRVPRGYQVSCCTSASSPYAAGVAALLISGAKQRRMPYSLASLGRAMRVGSRFLPGVPSHQQGHGVLDVNAAWRELGRAIDLPRIVASAAIDHPLVQYAARPGGAGLFEIGTWTAGMTGRRDLKILRETGPPRPVRYRVGWTGNDGTFSAPRQVTLPLGQPVSMPISIAVATSGAHSALLDLRDSSTDAIVFRTQTTIVAAERVDPSTGSIRLAGSVPLMRVRPHYIQVPPGIGEMSVELEVLGGTVSVAIVPGYGLFPNYYQHLYPGTSRQFTKGRYRVLLPNPVPGTWTISLTNDSARIEPDRAAVSVDVANYAITVNLVSASLLVEDAGRNTAAVRVDAVSGVLDDPEIQTSRAALRSHRTDFLRTGLPNTFAVDVPDGASTLLLQARSTSATLLEMYLYDCTSGECFSYSFAFPAAASQKIVVRQPARGRWVAAVNAAPIPSAGGEFSLDVVTAVGPPRHASAAALVDPAGARWLERIDVMPPTRDSSSAPVLLFELIDSAKERDEVAHPWDSRPGVPKLRDRPVAISHAIYRLR